MASPREFLAEAYGYARQAGLSDHAARLAVAQSALETGYGRSVKGNNYHGIKAGRNYSGPTQVFQTWEEENGRRVNQPGRFRVYQSPVQSFIDWKNTVGKKWPGVFTASTFAGALDALRTGQKGGYASDKRYKVKINGINTKIGGSLNGVLPTEMPLPPQRYQTVAARPVAPTAQSIRTAANLAALPVGGQTRLPSQTLAAPLSPVERQPLGPAALRVDYVAAAPAGQVQRAPLGPVAQSRPAYSSWWSPVSQAKAAPKPAPQPQSSIPRAAPTPAPSITPKAVSAYQQYAASRMAAPATPVNNMLTSSVPVGPAQTLTPQPAQPTFMPASPVPVTTASVSPVRQMPVAPQVQRLPGTSNQFPAAPPTPQYTATDVYQGRANSGIASDGSTVSRDQFGNTSVTNKYGVTTTTNANGQQMASGGPGIGGSIGSVFDARPDLNGRSQFGNTARQVGAGMAGSVAGGLLGPIGSLIGAALASDLARPGGGMLGNLVNGVRTMNVMGQPQQFARPQSGGPFPNAPGFKAGEFANNRSERSMRDISPAAARDIASGKVTGLF